MFLRVILKRYLVLVEVVLVDGSVVVVEVDVELLKLIIRRINADKECLPSTC